MQRLLVLSLFVHFQCLVQQSVKHLLTSWCTLGPQQLPLASIVPRPMLAWRQTLLRGLQQQLQAGGRVAKRSANNGRLLRP